MTPVFLSSTATLGGYTVASFGTYEAAAFCAVVKNATGAINCTVTGVQASSRRHLLTAGVVVAYTVQTVPTNQAAVSAVMASPTGALASTAAFMSAGLTAITSAVPSTATPSVAASTPTAAAPLPVTSAPAPANSPAAAARPMLAAAMLLAATAACL